MPKPTVAAPVRDSETNSIVMLDSQTDYPADSAIVRDHPWAFAPPAEASPAPTDSPAVPL